MTVLALETVHHTSVLQRAATPAFVGATARVLSGQALVFVSRGQVAGVLGPGEHLLDPRAVPFLRSIVSERPGGAVLGDDVFWVKTAASEPFAVAGALEPVLDPAVGEKVTPKLDARIAVLVTDPVRLIQGLAGNTDHGAVEQWVKALVVRQAQELAKKVPRLAELTAEGKRVEHARDLGQAVAPGLAELGLGLASCEIVAFVLPDHVAARLRLLGGTLTHYSEAPGPPSLADGARVRVSRAGQWYSGRVSKVTEGRAEVIWDVSGERSEVALAELEPEPAYPGAFAPGTRLLAQWPDGGFYPATVRVFNGTLYEVVWADGSSSWLTPGQVKTIG